MAFITVPPISPWPASRITPTKSSCIEAMRGRKSGVVQRQRKAAKQAKEGLPEEQRADSHVRQTAERTRALEHPFLYSHVAFFVCIFRNYNVKYSDALRHRSRMYGLATIAAPAAVTVAAANGGDATSTIFSSKYIDIPFIITYTYRL